MKRLVMMFVAAVLVSGSAAVAQAQQGPGGQGQGRGGMNSQREMEVLFKDITLTTDQQAKLKEVQAKYDPQMAKMREEMMAARQSGQQLGPEAMQKMRDLRTEQRAAMRAVLTADQQAVFDKNLAEMPQGRGMGGPPPGGRPPRA
jgi:Spy/CpxP family protein refolding chaperone